jgi:Intracellular proteinase inhibitor
MPSQVVVGQPVDLRLVVSNSSGSVMSLSGGDPAEAYAFVVYDHAGHVVWLSLHDQVLSGVLANWTIAPHDQVSREVSWSGVGNDGKPLPPGDYAVVGKIYLSDNNSPESPPAAITLLAPQP